MAAGAAAMTLSMVAWGRCQLIAIKKIAPALAAGNSVVVKPSELAPVAVWEFAKLCHECGVPAGVLNVVTGYGAVAGKALAEHPSLRKVDITGGTETGDVAAGRRVQLASPCCCLRCFCFVLVFASTLRRVCVCVCQVGALQLQPRAISPELSLSWAARLPCWYAVLSCVAACATPVMVTAPTAASQVFPDADIDQVVNGAAFASFVASGQVTVA